MLGNSRDSGYCALKTDEVGIQDVQTKCPRKYKPDGLIVSICLVLFFFGFVFIAVPLMFKNCIYLQRRVIFTHLYLPQSVDYYENYHFPAFRNKYVTVKDLNGRDTSLGMWHILPEDLGYMALHDPMFDYDEALLHSNHSVLIYFHGNGQSRSFSSRKYQLLRQYFHVIAFDYRGYADSSKGELTEKMIVSDCVQLYLWLLNKTTSPIYIWGHSLGAAIAASTAAVLENFNITIKGLILESCFTSLRDEFYVHPYSVLFSWLPWFQATILDPAYRNGFVFDTATNVLNVSCPVMILHAEDDRIVPYKFGKILHEIASNRFKGGADVTVYHQFPKKLRYNHYHIYLDPYLTYFIQDFVALSSKTHFKREPLVNKNLTNFLFGTDYL